MAVLRTRMRTTVLGSQTVKKEKRRYVVKFNNEELGEGKFFTNSDELKQMLDRVAEIKDGYPFRTTIRRQSFGQGKVKYSFT